MKNFNISQERVNRQFAIGRQFYDETPLDEKLKYVPEGLGRSFRRAVHGFVVLMVCRQITVRSMDTFRLDVACMCH